mmetsp:Transcript_1411/g.3530  ORF Transcript_1411/g.3530 Transcript_1411/m.3530 type:complete len:210 (-) Transcript_1411:682-1311(-)
MSSIRWRRATARPSTRSWSSSRCPSRRPASPRHSTPGPPCWRLPTPSSAATTRTSLRSRTLTCRPRCCLGSTCCSCSWTRWTWKRTRISRGMCARSIARSTISLMPTRRTTVLHRWTTFMSSRLLMRSSCATTFARPNRTSPSSTTSFRGTSLTPTLPCAKRRRMATGTAGSRTPPRARSWRCFGYRRRTPARASRTESRGRTSTRPFA